MDAEKLLAKLEFEAEEKKWNEQRLQAIRRRIQPATRAEQSRKTLHHLRSRTAEIEEELHLRAQVEREQERCFKAERALKEKNRSLIERKAQAEETRQFQLQLSHIISSEHSPDWREQENPNAEFYRQQCTPTHGSKPKNR